MTEYISFKKPIFKNKSYISQLNTSIKINLYEIKIKNIKKLTNSNGYYLSLYLSSKSNENSIENIKNIDNIALNSILLNNISWFNNNLDEEELRELYKNSYCNQANIINCILSNNIPCNIIIDNKTYTDDEKLLEILLNLRELKKYIICVEIMHAGLYFYPELSTNKWLIKSINITNIESDKCEWNREDIENDWSNEVNSTIVNINNKIENKYKEIEELSKNISDINSAFNEIKEIKNTDNLWENKINFLKKLIINFSNKNIIY